MLLGFGGAEWEIVRTNTTAVVEETSSGERETTTEVVRRDAAAGVSLIGKEGERPVLIVKTEEGLVKTTRRKAGGVTPLVLAMGVVGETGAHHLQREPEEENGE